mmetsp:Transcript_101315/g.182876  ORF Transcript_101315/g.182876 Transcript_101315/m.182876 type:complete len:156 (-) Transcript_101315:67-534(-)
MDMKGLLQQQEQSLPPELMRSLKSLEALDGQFQLISLPLQRLQYHCGYKQCFSGGSSGGFLSSLGGLASGDSSTQKTLSCLERCEAPMQNFEQVCEQRMEGLTGQMEQCLQRHGDNEQGAMDCIGRVLEPGNIQRLVQQLQGDVKGIQQKYSDLE